MKTVSIVTSALNEADCLPELFKRIESVFSVEPEYDYKIVITDNSSTDNTWEIIGQEASKNSRISANLMSRTFSFDAALRSGIDQCNTDIVIIMASDLQDPPEVIHQLLRKYELGYEQVLVKVISRKTVPLLRRFLSTVFYKLATSMTNGLIPEHVSDFRLLGKGAYKSISEIKERHSFVRGLGAWVGFRTTSIEIERPERFAGDSKFMKLSLMSTVLMFFRSLFAFSATPLSWISTAGFFISILSFFAIMVYSIIWITVGVPFAGFGTIIGVVVLCFSITMLCFGIISQYLALIYEEVKNRPVYIISKSINSQTR